MTITFRTIAARWNEMKVAAGFNWKVACAGLAVFLRCGVQIAIMALWIPVVSFVGMTWAKIFVMYVALACFTLITVVCLVTLIVNLCQNISRAVRFFNDPTFENE
jgi:hypothetical protein